MSHSNAVTSAGDPFPDSPAAVFSCGGPGHAPEGLDCRCCDDEEVVR
jgi:hypothetical protein